MQKRTVAQVLLLLSVICLVGADSPPTGVRVPPWEKEDIDSMKQLLKSPQQYLVGAGGVRVLPYVSDAVSEVGVTAEAIKTTAELELRKAGIHVLGRDVVTGESNILNLGVLCDGLVTESGLVVYTVVAQVDLSARLVGSGLPVYGSVWRDESFGAVGLDHTQRLTDTVEQKVKRFANLYLSAVEVAPAE